MSELEARLESSAGVGQKNRSKFKPISLPHVYGRRDSLLAPRPDPHLFALSRPGGPLASHRTSRRFVGDNRIPGLRSETTSASPHTSPNLSPPLSSPANTLDFHSIRSSSHRSLHRPSPSASKSLERQQQVQQEGSGQPTRTYRNLKTLPLNMHRAHRVPKLAVLRLHVNQDTAKDMQADRMQAHWSDPLASKGYGRRPMPRPTPDLEGTPIAVELMHYSGAIAQSVLHCSGAKP
ncbi:hypothetical protein BDN71DRAFT_1513641 [Pleurotus eryngii]|uniref:Uncharacterized protein n=1 Tax=Pleurotus eryngii TaxID=5323 RepID=A0A9P6D9K9_PLEER|nr:hypothetical protein BDN71DRAFT_1513641 [Pleurotus eryngii]